MGRAVSVFLHNDQSNKTMTRYSTLRLALAAALVGAGPIPAGPDPAPGYGADDALSYYRAAYQRLPSTWAGGKYRRGTIRIPRRMYLTGTLTAHARVCLAGPLGELHLGDGTSHGLIAMPDFVAPDPMKAWVLRVGRGPGNKANFNANFDTVFDGLFLQCRPGREADPARGIAATKTKCANGLSFGGAQISIARRLKIWDAEGTAFLLARGSRTCSVDHLNIRNGNASPSRMTMGPLNVPRGTGVKAQSSNGWDGRNWSIHLAGLAVDLDSCNSVFLDTILAEHPDRAGKFSGCRLIEIRGFDILHPGLAGSRKPPWTWDRIIFDFSNNGGNIKISGRIRGVAPTPDPDDQDEIYYLDHFGHKKVFLRGKEILRPSGRAFDLFVHPDKKTISIHYPPPP